MSAHGERIDCGITTIVDDGIEKDPLVRALIVNAVYFKAPWSTAFEVARTRRGLWRTQPGEAGTPCAMMTFAKPRQLQYAASDAGVLVALPYADGQYRALFGLPAEHSDASLSALLAGSCAAVTELRAALGSNEGA